MKKRRFLLMEVLLAMALISLAFPFVLKGLFQIQQEKKRLMEKMMLKSAARGAFCDLKIAFFEKKAVCEGDLFESATFAINDNYSLGFSSHQWSVEASMTLKEKYRKRNGGGYYLLEETKIKLFHGTRKEEFIFPLALEIVREQ